MNDLRNDQNKALAYIDSQILKLKDQLREWEGLKSAIERSLDQSGGEA